MSAKPIEYTLYLLQGVDYFTIYTMLSVGAVATGANFS